MTNIPPLIRPATEADASAVAEIYAPYVTRTAITFETEAPNAAVMAERIAKTVETHPWLVADRGSKIAGFAYASKHSDRPAYRWTVNVTIYVRESDREKGVGGALYSALLNTLRKQGFRSAFAEIVLPNPGSVRLHEISGFKPIGVHKDIGFKLGHWQDISYWRLALSDGDAPPTEPILFRSLMHSL
jgi:L-amino acid N-acyltransferase YncA